MVDELFDAGVGGRWRMAAVACWLFAASCGGKSRAAVVPTAAASSGPIAQEPTVELPKTKLGELARSLVDVVNGGKPDAQREFVRQRFTAKALEEASLDESSEFLRRMWSQSGGMDVIEIFPARAP